MIIFRAGVTPQPDPDAELAARGSRLADAVAPATRDNRILPFRKGGPGTTLTQSSPQLASLMSKTLPSRMGRTPYG